jgi:hypothetical protein
MQRFIEDIFRKEYIHCIFVEFDLQLSRPVGIVVSVLDAGM